MDEGRLIKVIDVSDDDDQEPDGVGEYTGASLTKPGMPADFTVCGAFRTEAWTTPFQSALLFQLNKQDGIKWGYISMIALETETVYDIGFGNMKKHELKTGKLYFPFEWVRVCASLETALGELVLVVDGRVVFENMGPHEVIEEDESMPRDLEMVVGYEIGLGGLAAEFTGQYSNLNIFSRPLPRERLVAMTQAGSEECGAPGDFLSWEEAGDWQLHSQARMAMLEEMDGPCKRFSSLHIYTGAFDYHNSAADGHGGCMEHCQKLGKGRSPPVRTLLELETLRSELRAISEDAERLPFMWMAATDEQEEGVWRDFYSKERLEDYTKPWSQGHYIV